MFEFFSRFSSNGRKWPSKLESFADFWRHFWSQNKKPEVGQKFVYMRRKSTSRPKKRQNMSKIAQFTQISGLNYRDYYDIQRDFIKYFLMKYYY